MVEINVPGGWKVEPLLNYLNYDQPSKYIIKTEISKKKLSVPVLTPGKTFIKGYVDEKEGIYNTLPVIIFDDFTTAIKWVNFPFKVKSSAMKILKPKNKDVNMKFVFYQMSQKDISISTHKRHYLSMYQNLDFVFPSLELQQRIVEEIERQFSRLNEAACELRGVLGKLSVYRKAVLKRAFEMREGWEEKEFQDLCKDLFAGGDLPKGNWSKEKTKEHTIPIYANGIKNKGLYGYTNIIRTDKKSVTVSARGTIGHTEIRETAFYPIVRLIVATPKENIEVKYLKYILDLIGVKGNGISIPQLTVPMIRKVKIAIPKTKEEQKKIVAGIEERFSVVDAVEMKVEASLSKLERMQKSILKSAFEGKLVKEDGVIS